MCQMARWPDEPDEPEGPEEAKWVTWSGEDDQAIAGKEIEAGVHEIHRAGHAAVPGVLGVPGGVSASGIREGGDLQPPSRAHRGPGSLQRLQEVCACLRLRGDPVYACSAAARGGDEPFLMVRFDNRPDRLFGKTRRVFGYRPFGASARSKRRKPVRSCGKEIWNRGEVLVAYSLA